MFFAKTAELKANFFHRSLYSNGTCTGTTTLPVTVLNVQPGVSGPGDLCEETIGTYETEPGMLAYIWTISPGGTILSGAGTNVVTAKWSIAGAQSISCIYTNPAGCKAPCATVFPLNIYETPVPLITGPTTSYAGATGVTYSTESGMTDYTWTISAGGTITAGSGTNSITVTWITAGEQSISVNYTNSYGCIALLPSTLNVLVTPLPQGPGIDPGGNTGNDVINGLNQSSDKLPEFNVYPVPNDGKFTISITSFKYENYSVRIYNSLGVEVYCQKNILVNGVHKQDVDISSAIEGVYMVVIRSGDNQATRRVLIKK